MLLDCIAPLLKAQTVSIPLTTGETLSSQGAEVLQAIMTGAIAPDNGSQLIAAFSAETKIVETDELVRRVQALELPINNESA